MHFGFSYIGLLFILLLMVPNLFWTRNQPMNYDKYVGNENKVLLVMERVGEVCVTTILLIFKDFNYHGFSIWFFLAFFLMLLYEGYWIRYFRSKRTMKEFYASYCGIPLAGASLPVFASFFLSIYGRNPILSIASFVLGIGHIGIHYNHKKEIE